MHDDPCESAPGYCGRQTWKLEGTSYIRNLWMKK
jgi:hypothetical protein